MRILVIGKGGREHAIARSLSLSPSVDEVHAIPGNIGMMGHIVLHDVLTSDFRAILDVVKRSGIDLVVIGPEAEIADGLSDFLRDENILTFAPSQAASQLEASKIFSKEFMNRAGVPTARFKTVKSVEEVMLASEEFTSPYILKADGLAAGKGVYICKDKDELKVGAEEIFEQKIFGSAGNFAIIEENLVGWELSYLILTNGEDYRPLPLSQDHKRLLENDEGPNTGGMGVVGPLKIDIELEEKIHQEIIKPSVEQIKKENMLYRGILYIGVMVTEEGPKVLEYNVRFGDPEAQVVIPLLEGDWGDVMMAIAKGELPAVDWKPLFCSCVVLAAEGYPVAPVKGVKIEGNLNYQTASSYFLHAGTGCNKESETVVDGGRVINAIGIGSTLKESVKNAYDQAEQVSWVNVQMRRDIGQKILY